MQNLETIKQSSGKTDHAQITSATLHIIDEQTFEWKFSVYTNFVDFQKAFESLNSNLIWAPMRHHGMLEKPITIIQKLYQPSSCQVARNGSLSEPFSDTAVSQGCLL